MRWRIKNEYLQLHKGCEGCIQKCKYNGSVADPEKAKQTIEPFSCNVRRR
jgi:hypothetical protein